MTAPTGAFRIRLGSDAAEHISYACFLASLHSQESTGDVWAAISPDDLHCQLQLSESGAPGAAHVELWNLGQLGNAEDLGYAVIIAPTQESTSVLAFDIIPDVAFQPLPGLPRDTEVELSESVVTAAVDVALQRANALRRSVIQTSVLHPVDHASGFVPLIHSLCGHGFSIVHKEKHNVLSARSMESQQFQAPDYPHGVEWIHLSNWDQRSDLVEGICRLWEEADTDIPRGELDFTPAPWTPQRLVEARERALADGSETLSVVAWHPNDGVIAISTALSAPGVNWAAAELGTTIVTRAYRPSSLGLHLVAQLVASIERAHTQVSGNTTPSRLYASAPDPIRDEDAYPMARVLEILNASPICAETHLQMRLDPPAS
ncbi:hypothetical protein [Corynebacterium renale]|uniref:Uncharacterized protein n=1 Tax=Corynebacterium renale TaxID=1724 RepID=A0A2A9DQ97_9CORY|nr:hypothetical protein [Corynebacterium renale]PFG28551.1 hypothetical protein ATK06_1663 [Corynebacterium renale]SQI26231.1 acetyltransferase [Corynebacterium renale]